MAAAEIGSDMECIDELSKRIIRLERTNRCLLAIAIGSFGLWFLSEMLGAGSARAVTNKKPAVIDHLIVRKLTVIDPNGIERVVLGAPLPEPRLSGRLSKRGELVSGILLFDALGNERGGYVTGEKSGSTSLTLDEVGRAAVVLWAGERGESGLSMNNNVGHSLKMGVNWAGSHVVVSEAGKMIDSLPKPTANRAKIQ